MKLVLVRHADAGDRDDFAQSGQPDELRPLSDKGRRQMKSAAEALRGLVPKYDLIACSPLTRAVQTATLIAERYESAAPEVSASLEPDTAPDEFLGFLREHGDASTVIAVGHEPHLGELATWLIAGASESHIAFKKGGACLIEFDGAPRKGAGVLRWLMGPKELSALA